MDDLTYTLRQLCQRNRDGSHATQADRQRSLILAARQLREASFRQMRATSLKGKHVGALLQRWQAEGLSVGTLKNRMAHLRWGGARRSARQASCQRTTPSWASRTAAMRPTKAKPRN
nr:phage integrase N-terminal domain-containing protein [Ralstonia mannitolilytica]